MKRYIQSSGATEALALLSYLKGENFSIKVFGNNSILSRYAIPENLKEEDLSFYVERMVLFRLDTEQKTIAFSDCTDWPMESNYKSVSQFIEADARRLESVYPNWRYADSSPDTIVVNGKYYESEITMSAHHPEALCRRVKIEGKYYYFS